MYIFSWVQFSPWLCFCVFPTSFWSETYFRGEIRLTWTQEISKAKKNCCSDNRQWRFRMRASPLSTNLGDTRGRKQQDPGWLYWYHSILLLLSPEFTWLHSLPGALGSAVPYPCMATQFCLPFRTLRPPSGLNSTKQDGAHMRVSAWEYGFDLSNVFPLY